MQSVNIVADWHDAKNEANDAKNEANNFDIESVIWTLIEENSAIPQSKLAEKAGISRATVQRAMKKLQEMGKLKREGASKGGRWKIIK